jgi:hypothetical protein
MTHVYFPLPGLERRWNRQWGRLLDRPSGRHCGYPPDHHLPGRLHGLLAGRHHAMTTSCAARTAEPRNDRAVGLVTPLHWSDVDVVQRRHYRQ